MFIATREIRRSLGRFTLLTGAVALLVLLLLFFQAVAGTLTSGLTGGLESTAADVLIFDERSRSNPFASVLSPDLTAAVAELPEVSAVAPIGLSIFSGSTTTGEIDVVIVGGDPTGPSVPRDVADGRLPERPGEALFSGSSFDPGLEIGDEVAVGEVVFVVVGVADNAAFQVSATLYTLFEDYVTVSQERAGAPIEVPLSLIGVTVADGADPKTAAQSINNAIEGIEALDRSAAVDALPGVGQITQSFSVLYLLLYIVVTIVTGVFFLILTVQKKDALVLLRAVGASGRDIVTSVLLQVLFVTAVGAVLGTAVTAGLLAATSGTFGAELDPTTTAISVALVVALGLLASIGAVRRVFAIDPVAATYSGGI